MRPLYEDTPDNIEIFHKVSSHISPHLHKSMECVYVTKGTLEIGVGQNLFHMERGDFALVFPDCIHHYQVFEPGSKAIYLLASPTLAGGFLSTLQQFRPDSPVVNADALHPDVVYAIKSLLNNSCQGQEHILHQAFIQIILARIVPLLSLHQKKAAESMDIIYQTVSYIAAHFTEELSLTSMAKDLGFSPYALSRVFSSTFHCNFNQYINNTRLEYACNLLHYTSESITDIYGMAGFESQRTFNRVFKETYHLSPREYRTTYGSQK